MIPRRIRSQRAPRGWLYTVPPRCATWALDGTLARPRLDSRTHAATHLGVPARFESGPSELGHVRAPRSFGPQLPMDVRLREEPLDPLDPLARHVVPESRLSLVEPDELQRSPDPSASLSTLVRPDEPAESIRRTLAFLRLPTHTQDLISRTSPRDTPAQFGLSNAHRLLAAFPAATVQPTLRAILDSGVTLVMTWADAAPAGSRAYDFVLGLEGGGPADWKDAVLHCVIGNSEGPVRAGRRLKLGQLGPIVDVLGPMGLSRS